MVISFVTALTLMLAFIFGSPNAKRYKRDGLSFEESRFYCLHCTYCYISAKLHPLLLVPRPAGTSLRRSASRWYRCMASAVTQIQGVARKARAEGLPP